MNETRKQPSVAGPRVAAVSSVDIVAISPRGLCHLDAWCSTN